MGRSKLSRRGRKIKCHQCFMVGHNSKSYQTSPASTHPLARVVLTTPVPLAPYGLAPPVHSQTVASKSICIITTKSFNTANSFHHATFLTQQILTRLRNKRKQVVQRIRLYTNEKKMMQILKLGIRRETMVTVPTKCINKRKGSNNKETVGGTQESRNTKKDKSKDRGKHNCKP
ncbi:hypothetical protein J1N35_026857 [Gossypium stocksii]|uniref:Uncharacterized protein n=1 Tax=Gossypium stocksii TaxID=47602 RepID=A0A9D3V990_9ROSI|nr:hypothetical protein J1N35_026857 [Gossypium stocksii]